MNNTNINNYNELDYNKGLIPNNNNNYYPDINNPNQFPSVNSNSYNNNNNNNYNINQNNYNNNPNNYNINQNNYNNNPNNYNYNNNPNNYNINQNNYNFNNNANNFNNNNYNNNYFNNNNSPFEIPNYNINSEQKSTKNSELNSTELLLKDNKFEDDKFCCCFRKHDILVDFNFKLIILIVILCAFHILLTILLICVTLDLDKIFHIMNSIQIFYAVFCLISLINNKCIRYFSCIFNIIFSLISGVFIFLDFSYYAQNSKHKINERELRFFLIMARGGILYILVYLMCYIFGKTFCDEHRSRNGTGLTFNC